MMTLTGGPTAPSGDTLSPDTRLVVRFATPYRDASGAYPVEHHAAYDASTGGWKPVGAADGTPFELPAAESGGVGPAVVLEERQVHADGSETTSRRRARLVEAYLGVGEVMYADPGALYPIEAWVTGLDFRHPDAIAYAVTVL